MCTVAVLMTCHNREELTLKCIRSLYKSCDSYDNRFEVSFFVVNDGCTDDTEALIREEFPSVNILYGDGSLYWNGGMHLAFQTAKNIGFDYYMWVNDDVQFYHGIIPKLLELYNRMNEPYIILSGYTFDKDEKIITYGGQRIKKGLIPLNLINIEPRGNVVEKCDSMHGNCVLIPNCVTERIGIIDPFYTHSFGDVDYGLRASRKGIAIYVSDFPVGICEKNPRSNRTNTFKNKTFIERFKTMNSFRHRPVKDWLYFTKKFGGPMWVLRFIAPYIKLALNKYE